MAKNHVDVDELFTNYVDEQIIVLKEQVKQKKREINYRFQEIIRAILDKQNRILEEIDTKFEEVHSNATEQKLKIRYLSGKKAKFENSTNRIDETKHDQIQLEIQKVKNEAESMPEISVNWNLDVFTKQLELICEIKSEVRPYAYLEKIKWEIHQSETALQYAPKTFEIDWPTGDIYFLTNFENNSSSSFSFNIAAFDRYGNQKNVGNGDWRCSFERKFCPIGMCLTKNSIFVSASGHSAIRQYAALPKEIRSNPMKQEECILKIGKSTGVFERTFPMEEIELIGQILSEPQNEVLYVLNLKKSCLNMLNLELEPIGNIQLSKRKAGWIKSAPQITKIELVDGYFFIFYDQPPLISICDRSGDTLRQLFDTIPEIYTVDPSQRILTIDKKALLKIFDNYGKEMIKISKQMDLDRFHPIGLKFDILSGRLLYCGFSTGTTDGTKNRLVISYL